MVMLATDISYKFPFFVCVKAVADTRPKAFANVAESEGSCQFAGGFNPSKTYQRLGS
jgi:hypothetical protein